MNDSGKTKQQLLAELEAARQRIAQLEPQEKARQLAEESLAESTDRYRLLVENAGDAIYLSDMAGRLLDVNPEACRQTGYSREELLGMTVQDLDVHETPEMDAYVTPGEMTGTTSFESHHRRKDGSIFPVEVRLAAVENRGKKLLLGFARDISGRKQAEESLRVSEERLRIISGNIYDWEYWRSPDGKYLWMSPSCETLTGYSPEDFIRDPDDLIQKITHPDDKHIWGNHICDVSSHQPEHRELDFRIIKRSGETVWVSHTCKPLFNQDGACIGRQGCNRDITDRKRAEVALIENEERFRLLVDQAPEAILVADATDHHVILVNKNAETLFATTREDLLENGYFRFYAPMQPDGRTAEESVARNRKRVLAGEVTSVERAIRNAEGRELICEVHVSRFLLGGRATIRSSWTDITKRKRMEKELQKSQAKLETALASIVDAVFISDEKGHFVHFNEAFATFHKFTSKEECAKSYEEYKDILEIRLENGDLVPVDQWNVPRALRGESGANAVYRLRRKDTGETWMASYSFSPIRGKKGRIVGAVVVGRDITEAKEIENKLRRSQRDLKAILDNLPSIIGYWDKDLRNRFANHTYFKWFGLKPETMPGLHIKEVIGEALYSLNHTLMKAALAGEPQLFERTITAPDGKHTIHTMTHYIPDVIDGEVQGFYALVTDISFLKHAEEVLAASLREKEVLLKEIHHRVKNNLQIISSLLSLQAEGVNDPVVQDVLTESRGRVTSMALIHEQLYRSRDLNEIGVGEYLRLLLPRLVSAYSGGRDISLELELSPITLTLDQSIPFGLILNELVTNALKHGFKGRNRGTVNVATSLAQGSVTVMVKDDGVGLPENFSLETVSTLGLQIVTMLANQLRGGLSVDTGVGTAFRLTFPHGVRSS